MAWLGLPQAQADDRAECLCKAKLQEQAMIAAARHFGFLVSVSGADQNESGLKLADDAEKLIPAECRKRIDLSIKTLKMRKESVIQTKPQPILFVTDDPAPEKEVYPNRRKLTQVYTGATGFSIFDIDVEADDAQRRLKAYRLIRDNFQKQCPLFIHGGYGNEGHGHDGHGHWDGRHPRDFDFIINVPLSNRDDRPIVIPSYCDFTKTKDENLQTFLALKPEKLLRIVKDQFLFGDQDILFGKEDLPILGVYEKTLRFGCDDTKLKEYFKNGINKVLNPDQVVSVVQMKLARWQNGFDEDRLHDGLNGRGVVSMSKLMCTEQANTNAGYFGMDGDDASKATFAGVCRDIMSAGMELLSEAGFRNCVTVSYVKTSTYHTTGMCRDPGTNKIYKLNWGDRLESVNVDGGQALFQGGPEATAQYTLSLPSGKTVAVVPSEMGKTLWSAAGFDLHDIDPMLESRGSMLKVSDSDLPFGFVIATDGNSARYLGATTGKSYNLKTSHPLKVGLFVGLQTRPADAYGMSKDRTSEIAFGALEQKVILHDWKLDGGKISLRIENLAAAHLLATRNEQDSDKEDQGKITAWPQIYDTIGLRASFGDPKKDQGAGETFLGCQIVPGLKDVRNNYIGQLPIFVVNHCMFSAEGRLKLSKTPQGRAYLWAATSVLADYFGLRGRFDAGLETGKVKITAGVEGRLKDDMPFYKEGTIRRAVGGVNYRYKPGIDFGLTGYKTLEDEGDFDNSLGIMGNISISR